MCNCETCLYNGVCANCDDTSMNLKCKFFSDKREWVHLPVRLGQTLYRVVRYDYCIASNIEECSYVDCKECKMHKIEYRIVERVVRTIEDALNLSNDDFLTLKDAEEAKEKYALEGEK